MMLNLDLMLEVGKNISNIGKKVSEYKLGLSDYREYYRDLISITVEYFMVLEEYMAALTQNKEFDTNKIYRLEIKAWEIYVAFKSNILQSSLKHSFIELKWSFNKHSKYSVIRQEVKELKKELRNPNNLMNPQDKLRNFRVLGEKIDSLENTKFLENPEVFWTIIGIIISVVLFLMSR